MEFDQDLLEPLKLYNYELKYKHQDVVEKFFDGLTTESGVDVEGNALTCSEFYGYIDELKKYNNKLSGQRGLRVLLIISTILSFIVGSAFIILSAMGYVKLPIFLPIGIFLILLGIFFIFLNSTIVAKKVDRIKQKMRELQQKADKCKALAEEQMSALNASFDWGIPAKLLSETTPLIKMDRMFGKERWAHMVENYGMKESNEENVSTIFVQSGTLLDNPFTYERDYVQNMYDKAYTGSITISWTTWSTDSKGNSRPIHHTQTLTATITKPAAKFFLDTALIYANEAAPRLSFSRDKSEANSMSERDLEKFEGKWEKKLHKMAEDKIKTSFTPLSNAKFEGLFHAFNRDNEVEFRLLFTPLAQKNMIALITSKTPYGDDFKFTKRKMINVIRSDHAQSLNFDGNPYHFKGFDYKKMRNNFIKYNQNYFQGIFYDFAPLLSIPLYQQHRDYDWINSNKYKANNTAYEAEVLANFMDEDIFKPEDCNTHLILKAEFVRKIGKLDIFNIHSYGFHLEPQVEIVNKMGGDGFMHPIPVHWDEYIKVEADNLIALIDVGGNEQDYINHQSAISQLLSTYNKGNDIIYQRGLLSFPLKDENINTSLEELIKMFSHKEA